MSKSKLEEATVAYANQPRITHSEQAAFVDGALHLLEVAEKWSIEKYNGDNRMKQGTILNANALLDYLKSYCRRE